MLKPQDIYPHTFTKALFRGYNTAVVDEFLENVAEEYSALHEENATLKSKLKAMVDKVEEYRATEEAMRSALLAAQRTAEGILKDAETRRDEILAHASDEALARRDDCRREVAELEERMRRARTEMARFVAAGRELCSQELKFLEQLPQMQVNVTLPEDGETPETDSAAKDETSAAPESGESAKLSAADYIKGKRVSAADDIKDKAANPDALSEKSESAVTLSKEDSGKPEKIPYYKKREPEAPRLDELKFGQTLKKD